MFNSPFEQEYIARVIQTLNEIAGVYEKSKRLTDVWFARDYTNKITDETASLKGITKADLQNAMYLLDSLQKFLSGQDAPKANFLDTLNKLRSDI
jgi:DNA polymerase III epsilon subunit-like protein